MLHLRIRQTLIMKAYPCVDMVMVPTRQYKASIYHGNSTHSHSLQKRTTSPSQYLLYVYTLVLVYSRLFVLSPSDFAQYQKHVHHSSNEFHHSLQSNRF